MIHALLRMGKFAAIETISKPLPYIQVLIPNGALSPTWYYDNEKFKDNAGLKLTFKMGKTLSLDTIEYTIDSIETIEVKKDEDA